MITESMTLTTIRDAYQWASECGDLTEAQVERLGDWIWDSKPEHGCRYADHPLHDMNVEKMWEIAGDENHDDYNDAVADGADVIEFGGNKYAVTRQAELSNRVFPGWFGDAAAGEEYTAEWSAPAIGQDGREFRVVWQFDEVKGDESEPDSYDWGDINDVVLA